VVTSTVLAVHRRIYCRTPDLEEERRAIGHSGRVRRSDVEVDSQAGARRRAAHLPRSCAACVSAAAARVGLGSRMFGVGVMKRIMSRHQSMTVS